MPVLSCRRVGTGVPQGWPWHGCGRPATAPMGRAPAKAAATAKGSGPLPPPTTASAGTATSVSDPVLKGGPALTGSQKLAGPACRQGNGGGSGVEILLDNPDQPQSHPPPASAFQVLEGQAGMSLAGGEGLTQGRMLGVLCGCRESNLGPPSQLFSTQTAWTA